MAGSVKRAEGRGGLAKIVLTSSSGDTAEVYDFGATLVSYVRDKKETLFCGEKALFTGKKAIRGGVPVVFPQFGQPDKAMAQHGFLRNAVWSVDESKTGVRDDGVVQVVYCFSDTPETLQVWPLKFKAECVVCLGPDWLSTSLKATNLGGAGDAPAAVDFRPMMLLHTYYSVPDISKVAISGLKGSKYLDKAPADGEPDEAVEDRDSITFSRRFDRVYLTGTGVKDEAAPSSPLRLVLTCPEGSPVVELSASCLYHKRSGGLDVTAVQFKPDVVVWNPWAEIARDFADMADEDYKVLVCMEPGIVGENRPVVAVGDSVELTQRIQAVVAMSDK